MSTYVAIIAPESRGNVTLAAADYRSAPQVNSNYWERAGKKAAILYAYKQLRNISNAAFLSSGVYATMELCPGANVTSDADLWAAVQLTSSSWHHHMGTTALGTVLDTGWRVKGLKGLRVVGSSAAPQIPTCPVQASVYAMAYVAATDGM